jgi:hypothetical protein
MRGLQATALLDRSQAAADFIQVELGIVSQKVACVEASLKSLLGH